MVTLSKRASGILLHISSLPSDFGVGDMGRSSFGFVDFLKKAGQKYWQILPLNPTGAAKSFSPYACYSAFAGNPLLISPVLLYEEGLVKKLYIDEIRPNDTALQKHAGAKEPAIDAGVSVKLVDYKKAEALKSRLFHHAYNNFSKNHKNLGSSFDDFCMENGPGWLEDFACFVAFKKYFKRNLGITSWSMWPQPIRDRIVPDIRELKKIVCREIQFQKFLQFIFFRQWKNLKRYANSNGINIFGDVPIYIDHESSDVWSFPSIFKLNNSKIPEYVAGVPPDYYSKTGQLWQNPVYNWKELKNTGFSWWINRMELNFDMFDLVRLDHFRGFIAYWEVPACQKTAMNGRWVQACPLEFFNMLEKRKGGLPIVAENLGIITPDVDAVMEKYGFPGIRVLQFAFGNDFPDSTYLPHNYDKNTVAYTGTHDNNTLRGWLENEAGTCEIKNLLSYLAKDNHALKKYPQAWIKSYISSLKNPESGNNQETIMETRAIVSSAISLLMHSDASLVIIPMQDIAGLDKKARMNHPSTSRGNWKWQADHQMLSESAAQRLASITLAAKRY